MIFPATLLLGFTKQCRSVSSSSMSGEHPQSSLIGRGSSVVKPRPRSYNSKKKLKSCHPLVTNTIKKRYPIFYSVYIVRLFTRRRWFNWLKFKSTFPLRLYDIGGPVVIIIAPLDSLTQKNSMGLFMSFVCGRLLPLGSVQVIVQHSTRQFIFVIFLAVFLPKWLLNSYSFHLLLLMRHKLSTSHLASFRLLQHAHTHIAHLKRSLENAVPVATVYPPTSYIEKMLGDGRSILFDLFIT